MEYGATCVPSVRCPSNKPYVCSDGTCVHSVDPCPTIQTCPAGYMMCYDGSCVDHTSICPPPPVCPSLSIRCLDGSCRSAVDVVQERISNFGEAPMYEKCVAQKLESNTVMSGEAGDT